MIRTKAKPPWTELLLISLFVTAGVQSTRLYYHWRHGDLGHMTFWGADRAGIPYLAWVGIVIIPLVIYGLLYETARVAVDPRAGAQGEKPDRSPAVRTFFQVIARLREQEQELRRHHRLARESAERHEQFNEKILSSMESALITIDQGGTIITFNPAAETLFKQSAHHVCGRPYEEAFARSPQLTAVIEGAIAQGRSYRRQEFHITNREGQTRYVGAAVTPIRPDEGPAAGVLCLITDLTEIVELQQRIKLKDNLADLGEMSAGIAHEFKNALATISGYAQLIARESIQGEVQEYNQVIRAEVATMTQTVSNFLDFARPNALMLEEIELGELVGGIVRDLSTEEPFLSIRWDVEGAFGIIRGDRMRIKQALQNILRNAAEAISSENPERRVKIHSRMESQGASKQCVMEIEDTGSGILPEHLGKIFLPFFTMKPNGTGLGLAIAQKTVVQHNGKITANSNTPGPGMRFTIVLPAL